MPNRHMAIVERDDPVTSCILVSLGQINFNPQAIICLDNGLPPPRCQASILTNNNLFSQQMYVYMVIRP